MFPWYYIHSDMFNIFKYYTKCNLLSILNGFKSSYDFLFSRYDLMRSCWHGVPLDRPTFTDLIEKLNVILQTSPTHSYLSIKNNAAEIIHEAAVRSSSSSLSSLAVFDDDDIFTCEQADSVFSIASTSATTDGSCYDPERVPSESQRSSETSVSSVSSKQSTLSDGVILTPTDIEHFKFTTGRDSRWLSSRKTSYRTTSTSSDSSLITHSEISEETGDCASSGASSVTEESCDKTHESVKPSVGVLKNIIEFFEKLGNNEK